jgi:hypothetical protein
MRLRWFVVAGLVGASVLVATVISDRTPMRAEFCVAEVGDVRAQVDLEQGRWASLMAAVAQRRGLPPRATTIAIATAFQESKIHNIDYGDRDSVGLFQQRPSQGWGTVDQIMDPRYATGAFYDALVKIDGYESMVINDAAQRVQRSGFPQAYAQHEDYARALASALRGYSPARFTCQINAVGIGSTTAVVDDVAAAFGHIEVVRDGDDATYPLTGSVDDVNARGWAIAHYLVGQASSLGISEVSFDRRTWRASSSHLGWVEDLDAQTSAVSFSTN